ncbi:deoxynucleoside triphosphate triphosphohydrolase SAMHD1 homolog isoform X2 [Dendrobium catenatum]|uniref:deoxynucleoside triphosphate triphosphohydrolase SAMHD1 homolog isoform X2 n=1 Tax=Dendrobium catenatum TaxID=906689 RepID=UPI0010A0C22F|nr:deoxynucleoside triphosphate triphosphohydrolase SAMHD1 homolog isoform X2 [Dendrobium catenatum]
MLHSLRSLPLCLLLSHASGLACMVYPGAVHTRFEHSLGVYWLAGQSLQYLQTYQGAELDIDHFDVQTVKLAGLLHDIGHGPFSHMFEHKFLPRVITGSNWSHEQMSGKLVDYIVDQHHIDIDSECLKQVKDMIIASSNVSVANSMKEKRFLYDIVANGRNGIDVDKFDYIARDCRACGLGCNFQFRRSLWGLETLSGLWRCSSQKISNIMSYFMKGYCKACALWMMKYAILLKNISQFTNCFQLVLTFIVQYIPTLKAIELMVVDALVKANDHLEISSYTTDPAEYWKLGDNILKIIETSPDPELKESRELILRIRRRDLYQFCNEYAVPKNKLDLFEDITAQDIVCSQKTSGVQLREEDVAVSNVKIDLTCGRNNPLDRISFFKDYESKEKFYISDDRISHLLPASYLDRIVRVYAKKPELVEAVSEAFENFQLRMYGIKAQVHETPEKKKRRR